MNAAAASGGVPFNPAMLRWAREWRGRSPEEAGRKVNKAANDILAWERGDKRPTVKQARTLADFYERPFVEFFLSDPPDLPPLAEVPDFRLYKDPNHSADERELGLIQAWAEEQRLNALDLLSMIGEPPPSFPDELRFTTHDRADHAAAKARARLAFPIEEQMALRAKGPEALPPVLRRKMEAVGVLTLKRTDLAKFGARGMCLALFPLPVVMFASEAPAAQAFTLGHELGHVLLRQSAISGAVPKRGGPAAVRAVEEWCDRFAAAFLIPEAALFLVKPRPDHPSDTISDEDLAVLAKRFGVSRHAMLVRLTHLGYVSSSYYWDVKRPEFVAEEREHQSFGRATYYGSRYRNQKGDFYTALVLDALSSGAITNHNAAEFMGIKNLRHLNDVRDWFGRA
jgi:Zn-dependent peptidase ImmA (M78 family)